MGQEHLCWHQLKLSAGTHTYFSSLFVTYRFLGRPATALDCAPSHELGDARAEKPHRKPLLSGYLLSGDFRDFNRGPSSISILGGCQDQTG